MIKKKVALRGIFAVMIMLSGSFIFAQPAGGGGQGLGGPPPATSAPIDGGAGFLLAGIAAYAHRRLKSENTNKKD